MLPTNYKNDLQKKQTKKNPHYVQIRFKSRLTDMMIDTNSISQLFYWSIQIFFCINRSLITTTRKKNSKQTCMIQFTSFGKESMTDIHMCVVHTHIYTYILTRLDDIIHRTNKQAHTHTQNIHAHIHIDIYS